MRENHFALMGLLMLISFSCHHCTAVLSIPEEQSGISGPCPYCGTVVNSPQPAPAIKTVPHVRPAEPPTAREEPRVWRQARMMTEEETVLPMRPRYLGLKVAAGVVLFAGGVAGLWQFWDNDKPAQVRKKPETLTPATQPPVPPRPRALASATDPQPGEGTIPPPSEDMPRGTPVPAPGAVARNVSTAPAPAVQGGTLFPDNTAGVQAKPVPAEPKATQLASMSVEEKEIRRVVPIGGPLAAPGTAIIRFFAAKTWQERLKYTLAPEKVKPLMEAYYKVNKDGPIVPEDIELTRMEAVEADSTRHYFAFMVYFPERAEGIPLSVEETQTGCLIEWSSFAEARDMVLEKFYAGWRKEPGTFRVLVRRGHYFEDDVPGQDGKVVFDINPSDRTGPYKLWLDKDSAIWTGHFANGDKLAWNTVAMMVLTLQWEKTDKGVEYVRLREVTAETWHPALLAAAK